MSTNGFLNPTPVIATINEEEDEEEGVGYDDDEEEDGSDTPSKPKRIPRK